MDITSIIIIITFLAALVEKLSKKPASDRKGVLKILKLENIAIFLLGILLITQLVENVKKSRKEMLQEAKSNETHENIVSTKEKVDEANELIDSILFNLKTEIEFTREEFNLITSLNEDLEDARKNISKSISEYQKLNTKYSQQLKLEREKILNAKPDVRISLPKTTKDSVSVSYQFQLTNYGQRIADSVEFYSVMILTDTSNLQVEKVTDLKTNTNVQNLLSLPPEQGYNHVANSYIANNEEIDRFGVGFLLVKYSYFDLMTDSKIIVPVSIFRNNSLKDINKQYGNNVESQIVESIKRYLSIQKPDLYKIFGSGSNGLIKLLRPLQIFRA